MCAIPQYTCITIRRGGGGDVDASIELIHHLTINETRHARVYRVPPAFLFRFAPPNRVSRASRASSRHVLGERGV